MGGNGYLPHDAKDALAKGGACGFTAERHPHTSNLIYKKLFNILNLLTHLLDQHFQLHRHLGSVHRY